MLVNIIVEPGIPGESIVPVEDALKYLAALVRPYMQNDIDVQQLGYWRAEGYTEGNKLVPYRSVDWFLELASLERVTDDSINPGTILHAAQIYSLGAGRCPLTIFIVKQKIVHPKVRYVRAVTTKFCGTVLSLYDFRSYSGQVWYDMIHTLSLHEFGHLFGLVDEKRKTQVVDFLGLHCTVQGCVMRQGPAIMTWSQMADEWKLNGNPYCVTCQAELAYNMQKLKSR